MPLSGSIKALRHYAIDGVAAIAPGEGGLPRIRITTPEAEADIYLHGAQVTSWKPRSTPGAHPSGFEEVLFLSQHSRWEPGRAIRGGIPVCFPWFRGKADDLKAPAHGFARTRAWNLLGIEQNTEAVVVALQLESDEHTRRWWPYEFRATLGITVGARLGLALTVENTGSEPLRFEEALHTYFRVSDVSKVWVEGLDGTAYLDNNAGNSEKRQAGSVAISGPTDNAYLAITMPLTLHDPLAGRRLQTFKSGSRTTVVWNPWQEAAAALADLGDEEWRTMCCVEAANILSDAVTLAPGAAHTMSATLSVAPLETNAVIVPTTRNAQ